MSSSGLPLTLVSSAAAMAYGTARQSQLLTVLGTIVEVATLDGLANVNVPAGSQPGSILRLRNKGLPHFGGGGRGALYVNLQAIVPQHLSAEERKLYERLRTLAKT